MAGTGEDAKVDLFLANTLFSRGLASPVPACSREEECCLGIDEAGRGPVLGPMVYGAAFCPVSKKEQVKELGVADSKVLNEKQRDKLFEDINSSTDYIGWKVEVLSPNHISNSMLQRTKYSLNALSHDAAIGLIRRTLADGVRLTEVYVDTVGDPGKYQDKLSSLFPQLTITVAKKADSLYPIVSAASICAKVIRDECLKRWQFVESVTDTELGSGYPADPNTKSWLSRNLDPVFGYPTVVRFSWATCRSLLESKALDVHWPDDDDNQESAGVPKISAFFAPKSEKPENKQHRYFTERGLTPIANF